MYISQVEIKGFRNLKDNCVRFREGVNVVIGQNNSGKSNLLKGICLLLDHNTSKSLIIDDFCKYVTLEDLKTSPPNIQVSIHFKQSKEEKLFKDDLALIFPWLITLKEPYLAQLTYKYFLPESQKQKYLDAMLSVLNIQSAWDVIEQDFLRLYSAKIYGGNPALQQQADWDLLNKFDLQFLAAIRDVERDMFKGKSTMLAQILAYFLDYDIKSDSSITDETKVTEIKAKKNNFREESDELLQKLLQRIKDGKKQILNYAHKTGALFKGVNPDFKGSMTDVELLAFLRLVLSDESDFVIPATHNGLGYNNLVFMSLLLSKMQVDSDGRYLGSNAKIFPILLVEEPEAHLHPSMQNKLFKFFNEEQVQKHKVRQLIATTHSTHIASVISLDNMIVLHEEQNSTGIGYPGDVFGTKIEGITSKQYVERFLDATKADMLFSQRLILVEGLAEQLLLPVLAKYLGHDLKDFHISIINIGGRYFDHFLKLFDISNTSAINKKVACIVDTDPVRKKKIDGHHQKCYPFEYNLNPSEFFYKSSHNDITGKFLFSDNIQFFVEDVEIGKTFEYLLAFYNPNNPSFLTDSLINRKEIEEIASAYQAGLSIDELLRILKNSSENTRIADSIMASTWNDDQKARGIIAARYLNSVSKGENAFELANRLEANFNTTPRPEFNIPIYIKKAIEWICQ